jgi:hypothetical protein
LPSWSYGSWIYNYLCNQCLSFHHLCCEFEFWPPRYNWNIIESSVQHHDHHPNHLLFF